MDVQRMMGTLNQREIDYDKVFGFLKRQKEGTISPQEEETFKEEEKLIQDKLKEAEKSRTYIEFINPYT